MSTPMSEEQRDELRERLEFLNAKPWRGACPLCQFTLWCTETEQEANILVSDHIAREHNVRPQVWRDHE